MDALCIVLGFVAVSATLGCFVLGTMYMRLQQKAGPILARVETTTETIVRVKDPNTTIQAPNPAPSDISAEGVVPPIRQNQTLKGIMVSILMIAVVALVVASVAFMQSSGLLGN